MDRQIDEYGGPALNDDMLEEAQHLRLEGSKLKGVLKSDDGGWHDAEMDLDQYIGNTNGHLTWFGKGFSNGAKDIKLARHKHKPELVATLRKDDGSEISHQLLLGEKIENANGAFTVRRDKAKPQGEGEPF